MKLRHFITSLRNYGLKGCYNWGKRIIYGDENSNRLAKTLITTPGHVPSKGITLLGDFNASNSSLAKVMADFADRLKAINIPCQTCNLAEEIPSSFAINKFTDIIGMTVIPPTPGCPCCRRHRIAFWEFDTGFLPRFPSFNEGDPVLTFSDFCRDSLRTQLPVDVAVRKLLYPFSFNPSAMPAPTDIRKKFGIRENDFAVFFNFDYNSGYGRKNPDAIMKAFANAFSTTPDTKLVFKTMRAKKHADLVKKLLAKAAELNIMQKLITIDEFLPQDELIGLTNACDVYISLHRGEGFGLGIAEAMSLGKAVVVSDYSAPREFCNSKNSLPIPCKMVSPKPEQLDNFHYRDVKLWAEPDTDTAATALRRLYDNPDLRKHIGENGRRFIQEHFSLENFKKSIEEFLTS